MEINFDLLISGCNTRCRHCYVNGGPGRNIRTEDARLCLRRLDELGACLPEPPGLTLDNEPINHPDIAVILRDAASLEHVAHFHHGMTTGIALMSRPDRDTVVRAYLDHGCVEFGITLHGGTAHHDEIVRRKGAFDTAIEAANYLKTHGARLSVSLMFNRFFREDAGDLDRALARLDPAFVYFAVPNYTPHANMAGYEAYRASYDDLEALSSRLRVWGQDVSGLLSAARESTPGAVMERLHGDLELKDLFLAEQNELYLSVHQDGSLYMGNTGAETECLGDLRVLDAGRTAERIRQAAGNRDYGAFYDPAVLPEQEDLLLALDRLPRDRLYADLPSVLYRGLEELGIPTRILRL